MRYLLAMLCPPAAILACGKPVQFVLNLVVWLLSIVGSLFVVGLFFAWVPYLHAILVVSGHLADKRARANRASVTVYAQPPVARPLP